MSILHALVSPHMLRDCCQIDHPSIYSSLNTVMDCIHTVGHKSTSLWFVCLLSPFITVTLAVWLSSILFVSLAVGELSVCVVCGCIEVHSMMTLYCLVNGYKATALIISVAHHFGCFL